MSSDIISKENLLNLTPDQLAELEKSVDQFLYEENNLAYADNPDRKAAAREIALLNGDIQEGDTGFFGETADAAKLAWNRGLRGVANSLGMMEAVEDLDRELELNPEWVAPENLSFGGTIGKFIGNAAGSMATVAPGMIAGAVAGTAVGGPVGTVIGGALGFANSFLTQYGDIADRNRKLGLEADSAEGAAAIEAAALSAVEQALGLVPGVGKVLKGKPMSGVIAKTMSKISSKYGAKATANFARNLGKSVLNNSIEEGIEEGVQELINVAGESIVESIAQNTNFFDNFGKNFSAAELWENILGGAIGGGALGAPFSTMDAVRETRNFTKKGSVSNSPENQSPETAAAQTEQPQTPAPVTQTPQALNTLNDLTPRDDEEVAIQARLDSIQSDDELIDYARNIGVEVDPSMPNQQVYNMTLSKLFNDHRDALAQAEAAATVQTPVVPGNTAVEAAPETETDGQGTLAFGSGETTPAVAENTADETAPAPAVPESTVVPAVDVPNAPSPMDIAQAEINTQAMEESQTRADEEAEALANEIESEIRRQEEEDEIFDDYESGNYSDNQLAYTPENTENIIPLNTGIDEDEIVSSSITKAKKQAAMGQAESDLNDMRKRQGRNDHVAISEIDPSKISDKATQQNLKLAQRIFNALGMGKVVTVETSKEGAFFGVTIRRDNAADNHTFLNMTDIKNNSKLLFHTAMHELIHDLVKNNREAYNTLRDKIIPAIKGEAWFESKLKKYAENRGYDLNNSEHMAICEEEFICDTIADLMQTEDFWQTLAEKDLTLGKKILEALKDLLTKAQKAFGKVPDKVSAEFTRQLKHDIELAQKFITEASGKSKEDLLSAVMPESTVSKTENTAPSEVTAPSAQSEQTSTPSTPSTPSEPQAKAETAETVDGNTQIQEELNDIVRPTAERRGITANTLSETAAEIDYADGSIGENFDAHGIAKGKLSEQLQALLNLLDNGIDPNKTPLYTAPFTLSEENRAAGAGLGTATNGAYKDGFAVVLSDSGKTINDDGIKIVFINDAVADIIPLLQQRYPDIEFYKLSENKQVLENKAKSNQEQTSSDTDVKQAETQTRKYAKEQIRKYFSTGSADLVNGKIQFGKFSPDVISTLKKEFGFDKVNSDTTMEIDETSLWHLQHNHADLSPDEMTAMVDVFYTPDKISLTQSKDTTSIWFFKENQDKTFGFDIALYGAKRNKANIKTFFKIENIEDYIKSKGIRAVAVAKSAEQSNDRPDAEPALIDTAHTNTIPQSAEKSSSDSKKSETKEQKPEVQSATDKITSSPAGSNTRIMAFTELADGEHTVNGKTFTKSGSAFTLDGKTLNAKEIEKATRTLTEKIKAKPKAEEKPSDQPDKSDKSDKIEDYGEKIGGARKDSLIKYRKRGNQTIAEEDGEKVPAWRKKYFAMQGFNGKWDLFVEDKKLLGGARQITRSDFDSEAEALKHITEAHIANNYAFIYNGKDYSIHKRLKSVKKLAEVKSGFATREEAMKWALKNFDELIAIKTGYGEKDLATAPNYKRTGEPRLNRNVTAEDIGKTFGFRGVEFGLWENQQERQKVLNDAYDALYDLAELLDIPPRALSLNGTLGVGFGSRGKGGRIRAHYEPDYVVINLTKPSGAGTFAHEWAHALDHYFKRQASGDDKSMSYLSESPGNPKEKMRKELFEAFKKIRDAITRIERPRNAEEKADLQKRIERRETEFTDKLAKLRDKLANASTKVYSRRKKSDATPEQLRRFDEIAKTLKDQPVKWQGITDKTRLKNHYRYTNDAFEKLNDLYKEITGRTGFDAKYYNVGDVAELSYILVRQQNLQDQHDNKIVLPTDYKRNAKALDSNRSDGYWASDVEMFARAFSSFIEDKLKADNRVSEYLSYGSNNDFYDWTGGAKPFPEGAERTAINHAFQKFFDILETKTDPGTGNTAMFSTVGDLQTEQSAADVLSRSNDEDISQMVLTQKATNQTEALKTLERLAGKDITNRETGIKAQINSTQRNKLVSTVALSKSKNNGFSFEDHFAAVANIDKLFENGTMVDDRADKSGDQNIVSIKRFVAPVLIGDYFAEAYITVKETAGNKVYSLELDELKKPSDITGGTLKERYHISEGYNKLLQKIKKARALLKNPKNSSISPITEEEITDLQNNEDTASEIVNNSVFSLVTDQKLIDKLDSEEEAGDYITLYRSVQIAPDGTLHSPMAGKINGKWGSEIVLGKWEQADERPDMAILKKTKSGKLKFQFKLDKGNGKSIWAAYNPYLHSSSTMLNDQFSSAYTRPELVTIEVRVPKSELTSNYKAEKAKDHVGMMKWKAGVVQGKLSGKREVMLSRWDKPIRIVPDSEVAQHIKEMLDGKNIAIPANVVTPSLRSELEKLGVKIDYSVKEYNADKEVSSTDSAFSLTGDLGDTSLSPIDYRRSIDPLFDFVMEYTDNGVVNPGREHEGEYFTGSFISSEFVAYSEKKPQGRKQSDAQYQQYLARRERALNTAEGTPLDEIAAAYVRKFGGDEKEIAERILDMLRDLTKRDLISDRAEAKREVAEHEKEQRKEDKAEYAKMKDAELTNQVNELFESKEPVTVDKRWVQMHRQIYPKLYLTVFPNAENVPDIPSRREMAIINEALSNGKMSEAAAVAEPYMTDKNLKVKGEVDEVEHNYMVDILRKWFPIIKKLDHYFKSENGKEDLGIFRRVLSSPMWIAKHFKNNPVVKAIYQATQDLFDDRTRISNYLNAGTIEKLNNLRKQDKEQYKKLNEYLLKCDRDQTGAGTVKGDKDSLMWLALDKDGISIGSFKTEEEAWIALFRNERDTAIKNGMSESAADSLLAFRDAMRRTYLFRIDTSLRTLRQAGIIDAQATSFIIENAKEFFPDADVTGKIDLFELMREMGQRSGYYVPRIRHGRYMLKATKAGEPTILKGFDTKVGRAWEIRALEKKGYKVESFVSNAPDQDMMGQVNPAAMMDIINQATLRANEKMKNDLTFEEVTYTKKDGTKEQHLVLSPDAKLNSQTTALLKNMGGMFINGAWHFINSDITVRNNLEEVLKGQALTESKMQMLMQSAIGASLVDMIRENSSGSSKIQRRTAKGDDVIRGYEEDLTKIAGLYLNGVAGSAARNIMAKKMYSAFGGMCFDREKYITDLIPEGLEEGTPEYYKARLNATAEYYKEVQRLALNSAKQPALTKYMDSYIKDMLRNTTGIERSLGLLKGAAAVWLLTRPSGALNNLIGGIATNPAVIHGATNCGLMYAAKQVGIGAKLYNQYFNWNKYGKGTNLSPQTKELFDIIHENGWDGAELTKSATDAGLTFAGKGWRKVSDKLLFMFSHAEQTNRAAAIYASVQALCRQKGIDFNTLSKVEKYNLVKEAKKISDFGNGVYNKGNKLGFTRGGGWGAVADSAMLFQTYSVNYINLIYNALEEGNIRGAAWLMTITALAGGMKISVLGTILASLAGIGFADDGEEKDEAFYRVIAEKWGQGSANFLKYGAPSLLGVNMSGTYQDLVTDMIHDGLWDGNANITELPAFSIFRNMSNFFEYAGSGQGVKAAEQFMPSWGASISRAIRETNDGVTDRQGKRRKDVHNKYIESDGYDTALRVLGFNPIDISEKTDRVYSEKKVRAKFSEMRKDITTDYRNIMLDGNPSNEELADIAMRIEEYNAKVRRSKRNVPFIDAATLNNAVKDKDNKFLKEDLGEKDQKRIEKKSKGKIVIRNGKLVKE